MKVKKHLISNEAHGGIFKSWDRPMREWILKDLEEKVHSFHNSVTHGGNGLWHPNNALYYIILHPLCQGHGLSGTYQGKDHLWQSTVIITIRIFIYVILLISILNIIHNSIMAEDHKTLIHVPEINIHKYKYKYTFSVGKIGINLSHSPFFHACMHAFIHSFFFPPPRHWSQGISHTRQVLYRKAMLPVPCT